MDKVVLVAVEHAFDDLFEESAACVLVEFYPFDHIVEKFTALQKLHDNGDLHVFQGETVEHFDDVLVSKGFEDFGLDKNGVNVADRTNVLGFDGFDGKFLTGEFVHGQIHLAEAALTEDLFQLILTETATRIEILALSRVQHCFVLDVAQVIVEVLGPVRVEQAQVAVRNVFFNIIN